MILAGDVGGTKTSLALYRREARGLLRNRMATYGSREHAGLDPILRDFLGEGAAVERACIGVAGPVEDGRCRLTNLDWEVDEASLRRTLGVREAYLVNDLQATASSLPFLQESDRAMIQEGEADPRGNMAVLAAGTGLGEGFLVGSGAGYIPLASEGGHVDFAPRDEREMRLHAFLRAKHGRVSVERVLSGPGLHDVYRFLREEEGMAEEPGIAAEVAGREPQRAIVRTGLPGPGVRRNSADLLLLRGGGGEPGPQYRDRGVSRGIAQRSLRSGRNSCRPFSTRGGWGNSSPASP